MINFIELDVANTDRKVFVNINQIVNVGTHYDNGQGYVAFNTDGFQSENYILTKQSYEEIKELILNCIGAKYEH
ncbi:TPA: hypothetical protein U2K51_001939 [Acinetobacter nosocomialis]|nr:hypothetical protein [Acinetobacter nosocomialis]